MNESIGDDQKSIQFRFIIYLQSFPYNKRCFEILRKGHHLRSQIIGETEHIEMCASEGVYVSWLLIGPVDITYFIYHFIS